MRPVRLGNVSVPPITFGIVAVLVAAFIASGLVAKFVPAVAGALSWLPVSAPPVLSGQVWRLFTYALVHDLANTFHLLFNCIFIFMFGRELEARWGAGRYVVFFVLTVVTGGLFVVGSELLGLGSSVTGGASAFAQGLLIAWGLTYRERPMMFMFAIPMKGIHLIWVSVGLWVLDAVSVSPTSAAAHLGGMVAAAVLVLGVWRPNAVKDAWWRLKAKLTKKKQPDLFVVPRPDGRKGPDKKWVN